jgi:sugar O-acyltransferase (sialic acid O-acetyltransferase NeuD family)
MKPIAIVGASGHAGVVIDIVEKTGELSIVGLIDSFRPKGAGRLGYSILGSEGDIPTLRAEYGFDRIIIAIGDNWVRFQLWEKIRTANEQLVLSSVIHPSAQIARDVMIGPGTVAMAGVVVNTGARIGAGCILNTSCSVDHDCDLGEFSSLGPGVTIGGDVRIGRFSAVSLGAKVIHGVTIGEHSVIGAGATVVRNVPEGVVAYGTPARVIRARVPGDKYL